MINLLKKGIHILNEELAQYEQFRDNAENEDQAMSCGAFDPRFLARIKRSKAENNTNRNKKITPVSDGPVSANCNYH